MNPRTHSAAVSVGRRSDPTRSQRDRGQECTLPARGTFSQRRIPPERHPPEPRGRRPETSHRPAFGIHGSCQTRRHRTMDYPGRSGTDESGRSAKRHPRTPEPDRDGKECHLGLGNSLRSYHGVYEIRRDEQDCLPDSRPMRLQGERRPGKEQESMERGQTKVAATGKGPRTGMSGDSIRGYRRRLRSLICSFP